MQTCMFVYLKMQDSEALSSNPNIAKKRTTKKNCTHKNTVSQKHTLIKFAPMKVLVSQLQRFSKTNLHLYWYLYRFKYIFMLP